MSVFTKVLRAGEGKKVRRLAELVPLVNDMEPAMEARTDAELRAATDVFRQKRSGASSDGTSSVPVVPFQLIWPESAFSGRQPSVLPGFCAGQPSRHRPVHCTGSGSHWKFPRQL